MKAYEERLIFRNNFNEELLKPVVVSLPSLKRNKNLNFCCLENFQNLFIYHFVKNDISFFNANNFSPNSNSNLIIDFRDGKFFKKFFIKEIKNHDNIILYQIYMDGTKIGSKEIINLYLTFLNDNIIKKKKKFIYNISSISKEVLKEISLEKFLYYKIKVRYRMWN